MKSEDAYAGWPKKRIGDICKVRRGSSPRPIKDQRYFDGGDIPWIKIADATKSGKYLYETKQKVNEFGASFSRLLPAGSLILAASGTLGYVQMLGVPGCIHDGWLQLFDFEGADPHFLYYWLKANAHLSGDAAYGAAIQNINTDLLRSFDIFVPPLPTQQRIAAILSAYDDLIENNTRRIGILEEMARRLYEEWFVNFRFPGHEEVEFDGDLPKGWRSAVVGDLVEERRDAVQPQVIDPETPYVGLEHIPRRSITLREWSTSSTVQSTKLAFQENDILFGKIRPYFHKVCVSPVTGVTSSDAIVLRALSADHLSLAIFCISSEPFVDHATQTSNGTKMPRADWKVLKRYSVAVPSGELLARFNSFILPLLQNLKQLNQKNANLRAQRDMLLPKLVSGEIDVNEAEARLEAAE